MTSQLQQETVNSTGTSILFTPFSAGALDLPNRVVMAPMTRYFSPRGIPGAGVAEYYARRAAGGAGLIISEGTFINHPAAGFSENVPHFYGEEALTGWAEVIAAVHEAGGRMMPQLWHVGAQLTPYETFELDMPPVSASGQLTFEQKVGRAITLDEIDAVIEAYARSAAHAERLGFDGVELHGAHGYLIDSFFWHESNFRSDRFGGDLAARTTFACEIIKACRKATRPDFPISLRYSQWKNANYAAKIASTPAELEIFLGPLADAGVDIFNCSQRRYWEPEFDGSDLNLAGWTKKISGLPTISVGSVGLSVDFFTTFVEDHAQTDMNLGRLEEMMDRGDFDLIAVGRALLADPEWPHKIRDGAFADIRPFDRTELAELA